jgi:hypothetical protein
MNENNYPQMAQIFFSESPRLCVWQVFWRGVLSQTREHYQITDEMRGVANLELPIPYFDKP